jgi:hypothetical protein
MTNDCPRQLALFAPTYLARGLLKQNLLRAIRLWVWLRSLFEDN